MILRHPDTLFLRSYPHRVKVLFAQELQKLSLGSQGKDPIITHLKPLNSENSKAAHRAKSTGRRRMVLGGEGGGDTFGDQHDA